MKQYRALLILLTSTFLAIPGSKSISGIQVDAVSGKVVCRGIERLEQQAKEASAKAKEQRKWAAKPTLERQQHAS